MSNRPAPVPDELSEAFWASAADRRLVLARCGACGGLSHPPDVVCPRCGSSEPNWTHDAVAPSGEIRSWVVVRTSFVPGFDVPFVLVDVALDVDVDADIRLVGRLLGLEDDTSELRVGDRVTVRFETAEGLPPVPAFARESA